jgi:DMSO/TMAO reductase YedYZ molybdopterin-dependent catalytic subunit
MLYFPLTLSEDDLRNNYGAYTVDVSFLVGEETVTAAFTGALLIDVLNSGLVNINADLPNDLISLYVVATGANGLQAAVSWGEISPNFANNQILVAYEMNGAPPPEGEGPLRLVVPGDTRNARYVPNLVSLVLFDAPRPG